MELPSHEVCYRAMQSKDARFDGLIYVGVTSTGIYCRPVCPARTVKPSNCRFFASAAAAQEAGFRPCLRCQPETAPEMASWKGTSNSVSRALALIADGALDGGGNTVDRLAARLGLGERQLRRLFLQHLGASPVSVAQTRRVLFAKQLIHDTSLPMMEVAMAAGFSSLRRFNETFLELFQRPPSALRRRNSAGGIALQRATKATRVGKQQSETRGREVVLRLRYRAPYDWQNMLAFLRARAVPGVEAVQDEQYLRAIEIDGSVGTIAVSHLATRDSVSVSILFPDVRALPAIVARVRRLFDLGADIGTIDTHLAADELLAPLVAERPGLRAPGGWDGFEVAVRAVLGQQISVAAARRLACLLAEQHGRPVPEEFRLAEGLSHTFPCARQLDGAAAGVSLPMPAARIAALRAVVTAAVRDPGLFSATGSVDETVARLRAIPGVGDWTAQYVAVRAVREMDGFPSSDAGLLRGFAAVSGTDASPAALLRYSERWRPWRAYAAQHLWAADSALKVSKQPALAKAS